MPRGGGVPPAEGSAALDAGTLPTLLLRVANNEEGPARQRTWLLIRNNTLTTVCRPALSALPHCFGNRHMGSNPQKTMDIH